MTITELTERLTSYHYTITADDLHQQWLIKDMDKQTVASISQTNDRTFGVYDNLPNAILYTCVIHFANTPIPERTTSTPMRLQLTPSEIDNLAKLQISIDSPTIRVTNDQLHALRHVKKQLNKQRYDLINGASGQSK